MIDLKTCFHSLGFIIHTADQLAAAAVAHARLINIPNECKTFISIGDKKSGVFENELVSNKQKEFLADFDPTLNMFECCKILANVPIDIAKENQTLPNSLTFLEMYNHPSLNQEEIENMNRPITITEIEMKMLIESAVGEFNNVFNATEQKQLE